MGNNRRFTNARNRLLKRSFRRKDGRDDDDPDGVGRNAGRNFHDERRSNETHASRTDPDARLFRRSNATTLSSTMRSGSILQNLRPASGAEPSSPTP